MGPGTLGEPPVSVLGVCGVLPAQREIHIHVAPWHKAQCSGATHMCYVGIKVLTGFIFSFSPVAYLSCQGRFYKTCEYFLLFLDEYNFSQFASLPPGHIITYLIWLKKKTQVHQALPLSFTT